MTLDSQLTALERAELVRLARQTPELEYMFRHALIQDAAYGSLLKSSRRELHRAVGDALERLHPSPGAGEAATLARHFAEAGEPARALPYYLRAGEQAAAMQANEEALLHFGSAIAMAVQAGAPQGPARHQRGRLLDLMGDGERARLDYEQSLVEAQASGDARAHWQALIDLGFLWSARDYNRTGEYLRQAEAQARASGDPRLIAESLNRIGNWHMHVEQPLEARRHHREALALYESAGDTEGIAATCDLLGVVGAVSGDIALMVGSLRRAVSLFRQMDRPRDLATNMATLGLSSICSFTAVVVEDDSTVDAALENIAEALGMARRIGWLPGVAFISAHQAMLAQAAGNFGLAQSAAHAALDLAQRVGHPQWALLASYELCGVYYHLGNAAAGWTHGMSAITLARQIGSAHLARTAAGVLAQNTARYAPERGAEAESELAAALGREAAPSATPTIGERHCWTGRAALRLAAGDAPGALALVDALTGSLPNRNAWGTRIAPALAQLRGECLLALGRQAEASRELNVVREVARAACARLPALRAITTLAMLERARGDRAAEAAAAREASALIDEIAAMIPDESTRSAYAVHARAEAGI